MASAKRHNRYNKYPAPYNKYAAQAHQKHQVEFLMQTVAMPATVITNSLTNDEEVKKQQCQDETNHKTSASTFSVGEVYLRIRDEKEQKEEKKATMTVQEYLKHGRMKAEKEREAEREQIEILKQLVVPATRLREKEIAVAAEKERIKKWNEKEQKKADRITYLVERLRELNMLAEEKQRREIETAKREEARRIEMLVKESREKMNEKERESRS